MEEEGCEPNVITFSAMVKGHCMAGDVDEAFSVFRSMLSRGLSADTVIFNTLLDGCVRHSMFELADQLLDDMTKYRVIPSKFTLSIIVKMWGKRRRVDKAFEAIRSSLRNGYSCLDAQVGTCLISVCLHNNEADRAVKVLEEMKTWRGCNGPDESSYNMLISGLARRGDGRRAAEIAHEACMAATAPRSAMKALSEECLRSLFATLRRQGLADEIGAPLAQQLRGARMQVPRGAFGGSGGAGDAGEASSSIRGAAPRGERTGERAPQRRPAAAAAAPAQSLTGPSGEGARKLEPAWMKARKTAATSGH